MKNILFAFFIFSLSLSAQDTRWKDYYSYFNVKNIFEKDSNLYCTTDNGFFIYDKNSHEVSKFSKTEGLHDVQISSSAYNKEHDYIIVGYSNGKLDIIKSDNILLVVDIPMDNDFQGDKNINNIYTEGDFAYISTNYGISIYNLVNEEFNDSCFFKTGSTYAAVNSCSVFNNILYAATTNGIYSHTINAQIPNFASWTNFDAGNNYQDLIKFNNNLFSAKGNNLYNSSDGNSWNLFNSYSDIKKLQSSDDYLIITSTNNINVYSSSLSLIENHNFSESLNSGFYSEGILYGGTQFKGLSANENYYAPDGPYNNTSYSINILDDQLWISSGGRNENTFNEPQWNDYGYYHYNGTTWEHISTQDLNNIGYIMQIVPNPNKPEESYALSYGSGLIKMENNSFSAVYNNTNSVINTYERLSGGAFDDKGNFVALQAFSYANATNVSNAINFVTPNNNFNHINLLQYHLSPASGTTKPALDKGYVWIPSPRDNGVVVYNYNYTPLNTSDDKAYVISTSVGGGNLPTNKAVCVTIDNAGTAWIGTTEGLRILRSPYSALESGSYDTERIIIEENGIAEELFRSSQINAIAVDAANRKWVAIKGVGIYYLSSDGTQTLAEFNVDNSPLPSNIISDIQIDDKGIVYFVSSFGVVSYKGDVTDTGDKFDNVTVYPNPVRPDFNGTITIKGLAQDARVKITDAAGNLVYETRASGGVALWSGNNFSGKPVASGVYFVLMSNYDGSETKATKIAIIR